MAGPGHAFLGEAEAALVRRVLDTWELNRYRFEGPAGADVEPSMVYTLEREGRSSAGSVRRTAWP